MDVAAAATVHYPPLVLRLSTRASVGGPDNALTQARDHLRSAGGTWLDLTVSNPTRVGLDWPTERLQQAFQVQTSDYRPDPLGEWTTRKRICAELNAQELRVTPERTLLTASTSEAYGLLFKLLCDPGDAVLAPSPSYPLFETLARLEGVRLVRYPLRYDGRWHCDLPALRSAAAEHDARAILVVSPNNPTGSRVTQEELRAMAHLGVPIISDEVFGEYLLQPEPSAADSALDVADSALVFRLGGLSKSALLPQAKLAWTHVADADPARLDEVMRHLAHLADAYLSTSTAVQRALPALLDHAPELRAQAKSRLERNLARTRFFCEDSAITALHVEAGFYVTLRVPDVMDEEEWCLRLLEDARVEVQPGYFYDMPGGPHLVLSLLTDEDTFDQGLTALCRFVTGRCT